jgi:acetylornithine deacetylase/succinyl-diaminopimelate desuccinylase-like protein
VDDTAPVLPDQLIADLRALCAQPSSTGQADDLKDTARLIASMLRRIGLRVKQVTTPGAPILLAWWDQDGQSTSRVLLYHHYDTAPPGPWRAWFHEPFQLAERDNTLYGRGVAHGKGPLAAHIQAIQALLRTDSNLPCGLAMVIEGDGLQGSPYLADVIHQHAPELQAEGCLGTAGERDQQGHPICYVGSKGLLHVRLSVQGAVHSLPSGTAASVANPVWRLIWALNNIKGEDEDIRINGFYDTIAGPHREDRDMLRHVALDEASRLDAWQIPAFLFHMSGAALARSEVTLPTCNITAFTIDAPGDVQSIPVTASARLDFQLVPDQHPQTTLALLRKHLAERGFEDVAIEELPGGYPPTRSDMDQLFIQRLIASGQTVYDEPLPTLPFGTFAQPLYYFSHGLNMPIATLGLARPASAIYGPNEQIPLRDLTEHSHLLTALLRSHQQQSRAATTARKRSYS